MLFFIVPVKWTANRRNSVAESQKLYVAEKKEPDEGKNSLEKGEISEEIESLFYMTPLSEEIKAKITGVSYPKEDEDVQIRYEDLVYVHVLHYDFEGGVKEGELICNRKIGQDLLDIFYSLYENEYPIEKMRLIDCYGGDDDASMEDNNTSCFNYRLVTGTDHLSKHSYGLAIDVNPLYNPYVTKRNGVTVVSPRQGEIYADRSGDFAYKIDEEDLCYRLFLEHGFTWGGSWKYSKDYQHFEKKL